MQHLAANDVVVFDLLGEGSAQKPEVQGQDQANEDCSHNTNAGTRIERRDWKVEVV
jgi:hypothetical protein